MSILLDWLSSHTVAVAVLLGAATACVIVLVAVVQGRAISLWPPRIEGRPLRHQPVEGRTAGVMEAIRARKSVRAYLGRPVEPEKLNTILEAGRLAPSASNRQEWRFVVVRAPEGVRRLAAASLSQSAFVANAPVVVVACADSDGAVMACGQLSYPIDMAIALDHMTLAAVEQGLGTCWVAMFDEKRVKQVLGIPQNIRVIGLLPLGYPADPSVIEKKRLPLDRILKSEHW